MKVAYKAARIFDGVHYRSVNGGAVVVEGDRIVSVCPAQDVPIDAEVLDLGDCTLLPGLIDAHVHLIWDASAEPHEVVNREPRAVTALRSAANADRNLRAGVTTVRDLGSTDALAVHTATAVESGMVSGPRILAAGRVVAMTGGHAWFAGLEADGADAVRRAVRAEIKGGARCVKLMASGGLLGGDEGEQPGSPQLTVDEMKAAVEEAHRAGRTVAAHAYSVAAINNALDAGVDSIEHGSFLDRDTALRMRQEGVYLVPTLAAIAAVGKKAREQGTPEHFRRKIAEIMRSCRQAFENALGAGVRIAAGTDAGVPGQPHGGLAGELAAMVEAGATPGQALRAGTLGSAGLLNLSNEVGSLAPGKSADLIAVAGDPVRDIGAVREVRLIVKAGTEISVRDKHPGPAGQVRPARMRGSDGERYRRESGGPDRRATDANAGPTHAATINGRRHVPSQPVLKDVRVVSLATNVPGPAAAARLRSLGASVVKVEPPAGDPLLSLCPAWYEALARGQEVVTLDLKQPGDRSALDGLLRSADLLLTSSRPAALERLGLGPRKLSSAYPSLCRVEITGYPPPRDNEPGHDLTYLADLGLLSPPEMPRTLLADLAGAEQATTAALSLLLGRERDGDGGHARVSLAEAAEGFARPLRYGVTGPGAVLGGGLPGYNLYRSSDGWIAVAALEPHFWDRLREKLGLENDADTGSVGEVFLGRTSEHWQAWAEERDLPIVALHRQPAEREGTETRPLGEEE